MIRAVFLGIDGQTEKGRGTKEGPNDEEQAEFGCSPQPRDQALKQGEV